MRLIGYGIALALIVMVLMNYLQDEGDPEGVIPASYERSLEKAQGVEQTLQDSANQRLREMEESDQQ